MVMSLLVERWNAADVGVLAAGLDVGGRELPSNAWMALRRLGWSVAPSVGVRVNDRVVRMVQEQTGRVLRSAKWRADLTAAVLEMWPADPVKRTPAEWEAVRAAIPGGQFLPSGVIRSRTRQIVAFEREHGRLPVDVFELEGVPRAARMLLLSACDGQQASIERGAEPGRVLLRLQLPTRPDPRSYVDWTWVACPITLPPTVPPGAVLHLPTLRLDADRVWADLAYTHAVPKARRAGHTVALGVDWGLNTLLSAGAVRLHDDGRITALGGGGMFRAAGVLAKQHRLRRHSERLYAKAEGYQRLTRSDVTHPLSGKHQVLTEEIRHVSARRSNLTDALAWSAARWTVDQAIAAGATVIYVEDLRSMEARGMATPEHAPVPNGRGADRGPDTAPGGVGSPWCRPAKNTSKTARAALSRYGTASSDHRPLPAEMGDLPGCGYQGDQTPALAAHRRPRPHPPNQDHHRPHQRHTVIRSINTLETGAVITPPPPRPAGCPDRPTRRTTPRAQATQAPSPPDPQAWRQASEDTLTRTGPGCPAQPTDTRA
jgi:hypothetical protein